MRLKKYEIAEIMEAFRNSDKSYDELMTFLKGCRSQCDGLKRGEERFDISIRCDHLLRPDPAWILHLDSLYPAA